MWDAKQNNFDPKTISCAFVGYSDKYKGYKCFHSISKKNFMPGYVVFDEMVFSYKTSISTRKIPTNSHTISIFDS